MHILVLDIIHGGKVIGEAFAAAGHTVDMVDVYRGTTPGAYKNAENRDYDLIVSPVHLDPDHPLLKKTGTIITHHEAVRLLLEDRVPSLMIEITGSRGKTTTAHALASILPGKGVLHTSTGTYSYPGKTLLWKKSITPASVLSAVNYAREMGGWLVAEESLGVTGAGNLAIITSDEDYSFASGKKSALAEKLASAQHAKQLLVTEGITTNHRRGIHVEDVVHCEDMKCDVVRDGMKFPMTNPLFILPPYRSALKLAAAAAVILRIDPAPLSTFAALPGRMSVQHVRDLIIVDNANSGTNVATTLCAARYARHCAKMNELILVIGTVEGDGAVCEGFSAEQIKYAISRVHPDNVIWVGKFPEPGTDLHCELAPGIDSVCATLKEGQDLAIRKAKKGSIVLSVKTWR
jgi:UDP-N-acetylmuramyl pentapeptide synthase